MPPDTGLVARARGLVQHLVPRATLDALAEAADLAAFSRGASRIGADLEAVAEPWDLAGFERAVRQTAARHLATLQRWQRADTSAIDLVTDDLDRRGIRRLLRGAMLGAPAAARLEGLTPTDRLPERLLTELARLPSPSAVVGLLAMAGHPEAGALAPLVAATQPDLVGVERVLLAGWASRATAVARRRPLLRDLVALRIDVGNTQIALLLASGPRDLDPSRAFVDGGHRLTRARFADAVRAATPGDALATLQRDLATTPLGALLPAVATDLDGMERRYLAHVLERLRALARRDPLDPGTLLRTLFRIEAQGRDLRALAWGAALGTPPAARRQLLVTPWA